MNIQSMSNLKQRFIVGNISTIAMFLAIYLSTHQYLKIFFLALIAGIIGMALWEFYTMARNKKHEPLAKYAIVCSMVYFFVTYLSTQYHVLPLLPQLTLLLTMVGAFAYFFDKGQNSLANIAITLFGLLYLTLPLTGIIQINYFFSMESLQDGRLWLTYALLVTKMTDIGAYFTGKNFGKNKIAPYISPSKTVEGSIGGLLAAILMSLIFCLITQYFSLPFTLSLFEAFCLGAIIGLVGQFGDLAESLLKRDCEVKDSNQLPGLGGVLDTADSIIFTIPLVYFFMNAKFA
jgi:phosphatidate cytidylyltransferase